LQLFAKKKKNKQTIQKIKNIKRENIRKKEMQVRGRRKQHSGYTGEIHAINFAYVGYLEQYTWFHYGYRRQPEQVYEIV